MQVVHAVQIALDHFHAIDVHAVLLRDLIFPGRGVASRVLFLRVRSWSSSHCEEARGYHGNERTNETAE